MIDVRQFAHVTRAPVRTSHPTDALPAGRRRHNRGGPPARGQRPSTVGQLLPATPPAQLRAGTGRKALLGPASPKLARSRFYRHAPSLERKKAGLERPCPAKKGAERRRKAPCTDPGHEPPGAIGGSGAQVRRM